MYYRPNSPANSPFLKLSFKPGRSVKKAAGIIEKLATDRNTLVQYGFSWREHGVEQFEVEVCWCYVSVPVLLVMLPAVVKSNDLHCLSACAAHSVAGINMPCHGSY